MIFFRDELERNLDMAPNAAINEVHCSHHRSSLCSSAVLHHFLHIDLCQNTIENSSKCTMLLPIIHINPQNDSSPYFVPFRCKNSRLWTSYSSVKTRTNLLKVHSSVISLYLKFVSLLKRILWELWASYSKGLKDQNNLLKVLIKLF